MMLKTASEMLICNAMLITYYKKTSGFDKISKERIVWKEGGEELMWLQRRCLTFGSFSPRVVVSPQLSFKMIYSIFLCLEDESCLSFVSFSPELLFPHNYLLRCQHDDLFYTGYPRKKLPF